MFLWNVILIVLCGVAFLNIECQREKNIVIECIAMECNIDFCFVWCCFSEYRVPERLLGRILPICVVTSQQGGLQPLHIIEYCGRETNKQTIQTKNKTNKETSKNIADMCGHWSAGCSATPAHNRILRQGNNKRILLKPKYCSNQNIAGTKILPICGVTG